MIDFPFFRAIGSLAVIDGPEVKSIVFLSRSGVLRRPARALAEQANTEFQSRGGSEIDYVYSALVDAPLPGEELLTPKEPHNLRGYLSCVKDSYGWRGADENLVVRRDRPYLGVFIGPIGNDGVRNCYSSYLSEEYPSEELALPLFSLVAGAALRLLTRTMQAVDLDVATLSQIPGADAIAAVMSTLKGAYQSFGNSELPWNVMWMLHVDEGLSALGRAIEEERISRAQTLDGSFGGMLYPCFSLPNPDSGLGFRKDRDLKKAVSSFWGSTDQIMISLERVDSNRKVQALESGSEAAVVRMRDVDWSGFDVTVGRREHGGRGNPLLAHAYHTPEMDLRLSAFADISEEEYFNPTSGQLQEIEIVDLEGGLLRSAEIISGLNLLGPCHIESTSFRRLVAPEVLVVLPVIATVDDKGNVAASNVSLVDISPRNKVSVEAEVLERTLLDDGRIALRTRFSRRIGLTGPFQHLPSVRTMRVVIPSGDPLDGTVQRDCSARVALVGPDGAGLILAGASDSKSVRILGESDFDQNGACLVGLDPFTTEVPRGDYRLLVWSVEHPGEIVVSDSVVAVEDDPLVRYRDPSLAVFSEILISVGGVDFVIGVPEEISDPESRRFYSPLRACTEHGEVDPQPNEKDSVDLRGALESQIYRILSAVEAGAISNGHVALSSDKSESVDSVLVDERFGVHVSPDVRGPAGLWPFSPDMQLPNELVTSIEFLRFRKSLTALCLGEAVGRVFDLGGPRWISKVDLHAHLSGKSTQWRDLVDEYLNAYVELVGRADELESSFARFWARFPFAISIWAGVPARLVGVMLSPLHPVRLSWLASSEAVLRVSDLQTESRQLMAGVISGWQFPFITRSNTAGGALMAVPMEGGTDSLFAGWSMLVSAPTDGRSQLSVPRRAGDLVVPGVSSSGLDSSAIEGAVDDFLSANPFVSALVVDLAASSPAPRSSQIDRGLAQRLKWWSDRRVSLNQSAGGVRVLDSVLRLGEVEEEIVTMLVPDESNNKLSLTWRRYRPNTSLPEANVRIMGDSGVLVEVGAGQERYGVVAEIPLRRFELTQTLANQFVARSAPLLGSSALAPFGRALNAVESNSTTDGSSARFVDLTVDAGHALLGGADWTVVGESGLPPSALASLLQSVGVGSSPSTLWEWRPPFFDGSSGTSIATVDRRPYMTLARIPKVFSNKLKGLMRTLAGNDVQDAELSSRIERVIRILGARGVGLSSLISGKQKYRAHQKGALGFAMVLEMIDRATADRPRFVIPLDAANQYLNVLAGRNRRAVTQRADLLVMELRDEEIVLVPIEIKFYRLDSPQGLLPDQSDPGVAKAVTQAVEASAQLRDVARFWEDTRGRAGTTQLVNNAFASLVDAAIRLTSFDPHYSHDVHQALERLVEGKLTPRVGRPVVAYLAATHDSLKSRRTYMAEADTEIFVCDPRQMHRDLVDTAISRALVEWSDTLTRAFGNEVVGSPPQGYGSPESEVPPSANPAPAVSNVETGTGESTSSKTSDHANTSDSLLGAVDSSDVGTSRPTSEVTIRDEGVKVEVGTFIEDGETAFFSPGNTALNSLNIGVLGDMGTGKTQLCLGLVTGLRRSSRLTQETPMTGLILDYKRDYQKPEFLTAVGGVVLAPRNLPLDLFGVSEPRTMFEMNRKAMAFINIISMVFPNVGGKQRDRLREVIINSIANSDQPPSLRDVAEGYKVAIKNGSDSVTEILNNLIFSEVFSSDPSSFRPLGDLLKDSVVVVDLRALDPDDRTKKTLVAVFLSQYFEYMIGLTKWPYRAGDVQVRRLNSFVLVDEAVNIMEYDFDPLHQILLQGREYGVAVILSSQYLNHFTSAEADYAQPLRTWFVHRVPTVSKKALSDLGITAATAEDALKVSNLGIHEALFATHNCVGRFIRGIPFHEKYALFDTADQSW